MEILAPAPDATPQSVREARRARILAALRSGFSYAEIARDERISRERVRQIVLDAMEADPRIDRRRSKAVSLPQLRWLAGPALDAEPRACDPRRREPRDAPGTEVAQSRGRETD